MGLCLIINSIVDKFLNSRRDENLLRGSSPASEIFPLKKKFLKLFLPAFSIFKSKFCFLFLTYKNQKVLDGL